MRYQGRNLISRPGRRAFTLVEVVIAAGIVGGLLAASMTAVSATVKARVMLAEKKAAATLASSLMQEATAQFYAPPIYAPDDEPIIVYDVNGFPTSRLAFDDVGDYDAYTESPPRERDGTKLTEYAGWTRTVDLKYVLQADTVTISGTDTGLRCITVTVKHGSRVIQTLKQIRTLGSDGARP